MPGLFARKAFERWSDAGATGIALHKGGYVALGLRPLGVCRRRDRSSALGYGMGFRQCVVVSPTSPAEGPHRTHRPRSARKSPGRILASSAQVVAEALALPLPLGGHDGGGEHDLCAQPGSDGPADDSPGAETEDLARQSRSSPVGTQKTPRDHARPGSGASTRCPSMPEAIVREWRPSEHGAGRSGLQLHGRPSDRLSSRHPA